MSQVRAVAHPEEWGYPRQDAAGLRAGGGGVATPYGDRVAELLSGQTHREVGAQSQGSRRPPRPPGCQHPPRPGGASPRGHRREVLLCPRRLRPELAQRHRLQSLVRGCYRWRSEGVAALLVHGLLLEWEQLDHGQIVGAGELVHRRLLVSPQRPLGGATIAQPAAVVMRLRYHEYAGYWYYWCSQQLEHYLDNNTSQRWGNTNTC